MVSNPLSPSLERIAKEMADEILSDPVFRAQIWALVQRAFDRANRSDEQRQHPEAEPEP